MTLVIAWLVWHFRNIFMNFIDYGEHYAFPILRSKKAKDYNDVDNKRINRFFWCLLIVGYSELSLVGKQIITVIFSIVFSILILLINLSVAKHSSKEKKALIYKDTFLHMLGFVVIISLQVFIAVKLY